MLLLDFINVGYGDATLIRQVDAGVQTFAMLVDCGHYALERDDHPARKDVQSRRILAGDFLRERGIAYLDYLVLTHFHRDHVGGLGKVLENVEVGELLTTYLPPQNSAPLEPDGDNGLGKAARNALRCADIYARALREHPGKIRKCTELTGEHMVTMQLTDDLSMEILFSDPGLYARQKELYDAAFRGERDHYGLVHWSKCMNIASLRQRLYYHGKQIVLGGDVYAHMWESETARPCDILKVPHHGCISSTTRKLLEMLSPKTAVISVAAERPDEQPHPYTVGLIRQYSQLHFTDAVSIPGLVEPQYHESVHLEIE